MSMLTDIVPYFKNVKFVRVCSLVDRYIVNKFDILFSFNITDTKMFPCLYNIRLSYNL